MRDRIRPLFAALATLALSGAVLAPAPAAAVVAAPKVVIIVGPTGSATAGYKSQGDDVATAATAAGATVVKVYSPQATFANVKAAVNGANIIVYLGHGNGYPNPYNSSLYPDRNDGWGLNISTSGGDSETNMVYCGEGPLTGTGYSTWGSPQKAYCSGGPITPAPGFVMIYSDACYAPGASEPQNPVPTTSVALQHVAYFSRPMIGPLGAGAYFATDHGADSLVAAILANPDMAFGDVYMSDMPYGATAAAYQHLLLGSYQEWLGTSSSRLVYTYAFAGDPAKTFNGGTASYQGPAQASSGVTRIGGADRYVVSAGVSAATFAPGVPVAYVATGAVFPDALSAGPAAAHNGGPVLLTTRDQLPAVIASELSRLKPQRIVVVGGPASVSDAVLTALQQYTTGSVTRIGGPDRYAVAAGVSAATFGAGVKVAYVATGTVFADALSAGPAVAQSDGPVLLTMPTQLPDPIVKELIRLKPAKIVVAGGPASVSDAVLAQLKQYATSGSVTRIGGPDRYAVSAGVSAANFPSAGTVYVATGGVFPDALSGGSPAALAPGPMLLTTPWSLPASISAEIQRLSPQQIVVLGGPASVSATVLGQLAALVGP